MGRNVFECAITGRLFAACIILVKGLPFIAPAHVSCCRQSAIIALVRAGRFIFGDACRTDCAF